MGHSSRNVNLKTDKGAELITFMRDTFNLELNNDPAVSTTKDMTCIDAVFTRHIDHVQTMNYISYFSYYNPLLSITDGRQSTQA